MKVGDNCAACGTCVAVCPFFAIRIVEDKSAVIDAKKCTKCGICVKACPLGVIA
ncbi:MAG: 4Fe-4S binding protein [Candidatus Aenigmatarchaeota archaeon]